MTDITDCPDCYKKYLEQNKGRTYSCDVKSTKNKPIGEVHESQ